MIVAKRAQLVEDQVRLATMLQQGDLELGEGEVLLHQLTHSLFEAAYLLFTEGIVSVDLAKVPSRSNGVIDSQASFREELLKSRRQQKRQRAPVDAHTVRLAQRDRSNPGIYLDGIGELAQLAIYDRADDRRGRGILPRQEFR